MSHVMEHCHRPWWKRPPVWFIAIAVLALLVVLVVKRVEKSAVMPYGAFLDQVEAGNVASIAFQGTEIDGRFKQPVGSPTQGYLFRSRVPDFGDPALIPELRKQRVIIDVRSPSAWTWLLGRVPWPMLIFVGAILIVGFVRFMRGGKAQSGSAMSMPAHGIVGLVSGLFAKKDQAARNENGESKSR